MDDKNPKKKRSLNNTLIDIINISGIIIVCALIIVLIVCRKMNITTIILSCLLIGSTLLNIHWLSKEKN